MRFFTLKLSVFFLALTGLVLGGAKQGTIVGKHLPLDGVPGVVMKNRQNSLYLPNRVIVKLMPRTATSLSKSVFGVESIDRVLSGAMGVDHVQMFAAVSTPQKPGDVDLSLFYTVSYSSPNDPFTLAEELSKLPEVQYAEPWFIQKLAGDFAPNDSLYRLGLQWSLKKINAPAAWDITQGDSTIVVAIVDSGVELDHPDLQANIWTNPGETGLDAQGHDKRFNGVDDDGDGYIDDWRGWDLVGAQYQTYDPAVTKGDSDPSPTGSNNNHGTHVAGIVAAVTNNLTGVASLASKCKILAIKTTADNDTRGGGDAYVLAGYQGIVYAVTMGAKIINCSWGAAGGAQTEQDIIDYATQHGSLVIGAAGNESSDTFFSPADYRGAFSVASTDINDKLSWYSNYGMNIDVCAPGENITSTMYPHTYASMSGTSMASPLAASLAALVKGRFPSYTNLQVAEQVRVTCDNIDALNIGFTGALGRGRINAYRALTVTTLPSVRLQSYTIGDSPGGNGNGVPQPAETLSVSCSFRNYLAPTSSSALIRLISDSPYLVVTQGTFPTASLGTLDTISNKSAPFRVYVQPSVPPSFEGHLQLAFSDGAFTDTQIITLLVNPTFATQDVNDIQLTLTNNGRLGFYDFPDNTLGSGFVFHGVNHLFEGGLMIGTSSTQLVDVVRNITAGQDQDLTSNSFFTLKTPGVTSDQDGFTTFSDSGAPIPNRIGVQVKMQSYAYSDPIDSKYIILQYDIQNTSSTTLIKNLYAGIFLDWDIGKSDTEIVLNYSRYDPTRSLGYAFSSKVGGLREYLGIRALDSAASFRSLVNSGSIDLSRAAKWDWMTGGFAASTAGPADIHQAISSGPYTIAPGATRTVSFALVAGDSSLANIQQSADAARAKWRRLTVGIAESGTSVPMRYELMQNYPNPFNPTTAISYQLTAVNFVTLKVFDILGREVAVLVNEVRQPGIHTVRWDASSYPSGVYLYRLQAGDFRATRKLMVLK